VIPHVLHFSLPEKASAAQMEAVQTARQLHPDWEIMLWQDPVDPTDFRLGRFWDRANSGAQLADLMRLDVVLKFGGVYLDSDVHVHRSFAPLADSFECFVASEDGHVLTNAVFGASAGHPAVEALISSLENSEPDWTLPPNVSTGPRFFAREWRWRDDVTVLPRATFYPYNFHERPGPAHRFTYATHAWSGSWVDHKSTPKIRVPRPRATARKAVDAARYRASRSERFITATTRRTVSTPATERVIVRTIHGHRILVAGTDYSVAPELMSSGYYELREELFVKRALRGGDYFIDVGANFGVYALLAASAVGPFGRVFAYEPNPTVADLLANSATMNWVHDRLRLRCKAVGSQPGEAVLTVQPARLGDATLAAASGGTASSTASYLGETEHLRTEVVSLDQEFPVDVPIRIMKVDAEGFEVAVLQGADRLLKNRAIDFVMVEAIAEVSGAGWESLLAKLGQLTDYGYRPHSLGRDGVLVPITMSELRYENFAGRTVVLSIEGSDGLPG